MLRCLAALILVTTVLSVEENSTSHYVCCDDAPRMSTLTWTYYRGRSQATTVSRAFSDDGRQGLAYILRTWKGRTGVEIGVKDAFFSSILLGRTMNLTLYMVDPWIYQENYKDLIISKFGTGDRVYNEVLKKMVPYGERAVVMRNTSAAAAPLFVNHSLDFVYIDARHDYAAVKEDLELWWPKLAPGGIMSGHDFYYANDSCVRKSGQDWEVQADGTRSWKGVRGAVEEFFSDKRTLHIIQAGWRMGRILTSLHKTIRRPLLPRMRLPEVRAHDCRFPSWMVIKRRNDWS